MLGVLQNLIQSSATPAQVSFREAVKANAPDDLVINRALNTKRHEQMRARLPLLIGLNIVGLFILCLTLWAQALMAILMGWSVMLLALLGIWTGFAIRISRYPAYADAQRTGQLNINTYIIFIIGMVWASLPLIIWEAAGVSRQFTIGAVMLTLMAGTVILMGQLAKTSLHYIIPMGIGICVPLFMSPSQQTFSITFAVALFGGISVIASKKAAQDFKQYHRDETRLRESVKHVKLMLTTFGGHSEDVFWHTDHQGKISDKNLSGALMQTSHARFPVGSNLADMFDNPEHRAQIQDAFQARIPFQDIIVEQTYYSGPRRWLSLSGQPILDSTQRFIGFRGIARDITQTKTTEIQLRRLANYDVITGLPNREALKNQVNASLRNKDGSSRLIRALLILSADDLKWVNESLGHDCGDIFIRKYAERLQSIIKPPHFVARLGGDECAVLLQCQSIDGLKQILVQLQNTLAKPFNLSGASAHTTTTMGVRVFPTEGEVDSATLFKHAGLALAAATKHSKGSWKVFVPKMEENARTRAQLEQDLRLAISRRELDLNFQPLFDGESQKIVGAEVLTRWEHPLKGRISPEKFISYAEDSGLIVELGDWIIRTALNYARQLPDQVRISINLSPLQLHSSNLLNNIVNALAHSGLSAERLELEVTERLFLKANAFTLQRLKSLKELGIKIALDDFGVGYSSLAYLMRFPFDKLKIDQSFIKALETDKQCRAITMATLRMARSLNMRCTAEGIETEFQKDFLIEHGCDELQGFFLGKPQSLEKFLALFPNHDGDEAERTRLFSIPRQLKMDWQLQAK